MLSSLPEPCYTVDETMKELSKSRNTIYRYISEKKLVAYRIGISKEWFVSKASTDAMKAVTTNIQA